MISDDVRIGRAPTAPTTDRDLVVGLSPFGMPDAALVAAVCHSGALGVLDIGGPGDRARVELARLAAWTQVPFGVRVSRTCELSPGDLQPFADRIAVLMLEANLADDPAAQWPAAAQASSWRVMAEVTSVDEAVTACRNGAAGIVAVGNEAAGRVGQLSSFILLQQLLAAEVELPIWVRGGVGPDIAAGAVAGGAAGVVLDVQLSLLAEADAAAVTATSACRLDASTTVVAGYRVQVPPVARLDTDQLDAMTEQDVLNRVLPSDGQPAWTMLGQDGLLAETFARRFATVPRAVRAVRAAVATACDQSSAAQAAQLLLSADSPLCAAFGLRRPIVQGPMTRVSDLPEFARAIAEDGAMPCVALAMANRAATTRMLHGTRDLLGDRPWGVGILGFGDEETRAAQLEVIRETKPSLVVIAGGQPAQAAGLEAEGIAAFIHVPSPVLLRQYLQAGSRRFIFEGTECGGHIGPLASFPLWQAQLDVLAEFVDGAKEATGLQVLFAGGIHDARSAAMVAAAAGQLAARGVAVGLLMGTAYLFTEEAVATGAIQRPFQQQVIAADSTAVLQSAPGHLTRCVPSPFVVHFQRERQRLADQGQSGPAAWATLEKLNVGRLRVAAKGVTRRDDDLVTVDAREQLAEGLFMAGQVAALRTAATSIPALHDSVTVEAAEFLAAGQHAEAEPPTDQAVGAVDIAIVGMACLLPKAADLAEYWANIVNGVDAIEEIPAHRWDPEVYFDGELGTKPSGRYTSSKWGGFLPRIPFDPLQYGIPPSSLGSIEPVQFLALEVARRALEDARLDSATFDRSRTAVVFGTETNSEYQTAISLRSELPAYYRQVPEDLEKILPKVTADTFPGILGNIIASRISNRLDLAGPAYVVDAACGSSLAALDLACKELAFGTADTALCGGADLHVASADYLMFSSLGALSPTGRAKPFDSSADGTSLAEGVACVVLKRLADAERDGDRIYAVVKGVAGASDGRSLSITAPRVEGQYLALQRTYQRCGISPTDVQLVEAHGTGTTVGDQTELTALTRMYSEAGARTGGTQLGSVKSQIGHAKTAAGLAGLIKVALSVYHGVRPPTLHMKDPNPAWDPQTSPFAFATTARPWPVSRSSRVGAVSAFGFGGANFHTVVAGHGADVPSQHALDIWPAELFMFRGTDRAAANTAIGNLRRLIATNDAASRPWRLRDLARTAAGWAEQSSAPVQIAMVATDLDDLAELLDLAVDGGQQPRRRLYTAAADRAEGKLAVVFPGQGSQRPGMLADLFVAFPQLQQYLRLGGELADLIHPPTSFTPDQAALAKSALADTRAAQPALGIAGLAANHLLDRLGIRPDMVAGHSYGELVALAAAGAYDAQTLLGLSARRAKAILDAAEDAGGDTGTMAAVRASADDVRRVLAESGLADEVVLANHNAPLQVVISGTTPGVTKAVAALRDAGHSTTSIPVACAFHSQIVATAVDRFATSLAEATIADPVVPVFANRMAAPYPATADGVRAELAAQVGAPVRFVEQIEAMYEAGARVFVEAGPGRVLTGLVKAILGDRPHTVVAIDESGDGLPSLLDALARLAVAGVVPNTRWLYRGRDAADVTGAKPKPRPAWSIDGRAVVKADGQPLPGGLQPARFLSQPLNQAPNQNQPVHQAQPAVQARQAYQVQQAQQTHQGQPVDDRRAVVTEFLRTSRDMLAQQRDVLLSYLGSAAAPAAPSVTFPVADAQPPAIGEFQAPTVQVPAIQAPAAQPPAAAPADTPTVDIQATVIATICETTGYPADMIEPDLDLEADLSIDSIKRTEIAGILIQRIPGTPTGSIDELTKHRTVTTITTWLTEHTTLNTTATTKATPAAQPPTAAPADTPTVDIQATVIATICETTGYPADMIEPDLDLEADLSIDSIKRTEIAGILIQRIPGTPTGSIDELTKHRTVTTITTWLTNHTTAQTPSTQVPAIEPSATSTSPGHGRAPQRFVVEYQPQPLDQAEPTALAGRKLTIYGTAPQDIVAAVEDRATGLGAEVSQVTEGDGPSDDSDIVLLFGGFADTCPGGELDLPGAYQRIKSILAAGPRALIAAVPLAASDVSERAAGLRGLLRTVALEYPQLATSFIEIDPAGGEPAPATAEAVLAEVAAATRAEHGEPAMVVRYDAKGRSVARPVEAPIGVLALNGAGPAGEGTAEATAIGLDRDSVVVLVGGARGITAGFTALLASAAGCQVELFGRSTQPADVEDPRTAGAVDEMQLRQAVLASGVRSPRELQAEVRRILAEREVRATMAEVTRLGGRASYRQVDVCDGDALRNAIKQVVADRGRIDGVVYAAGVIDDKLIADKDLDSYRRVFATKVDGARSLLSTLDDLSVRPQFVTLFGSIAAVAGNRGQSDYAAANDALETIGCAWAHRTGVRTLTVHWGPWAPSETHQGMVSPGLEAEFARRQIELINQTEGHLALLRELAWADRDARSVVYTASGWFAEPATDRKAGR